MKHSISLKKYEVTNVTVNQIFSTEIWEANTNNSPVKVTGLDDFDPTWDYITVTIYRQRPYHG